jgi:restriction system protein
MSIWSYNETAAQPEDVWQKPNCPFCQQRLELLRSESGATITARIFEQVAVCPACGWWRVEEGIFDEGDVPYAPFVSFALRGAAASLRELDLTDVRTPMEEVRAYLLAKYEARFQVHPRLMEETVASVFGSLGYSVRVTGRSGDDGIDVVLERTGEQIGVQVKRYRKSIEVEQIRSLAGALLLAGLTKGIFVTTSTFQRGALSTADRFVQRGYRIELLDGDGFYSALRLTQREMYSSREQFRAAHASLLQRRALPVVKHDPRMPNPRRQDL